MRIDVSAFVGPYPYRHLRDTSPTWLVRQLDRVGIDAAWVGHLPSVFYRDPAPGNAWLLDALAPHADRLRAVPTLHPGLPRWSEELNDAVAAGTPAVRVYPTFQGLDPVGGEMRVFVAAAAAIRMPVLLTVRLEDSRQRHPLDTAPELTPAAVRSLARCDPGARLLVTHADRTFVEEVHFGLTPAEARRVLWEVSWIWGPPEDHLALLIETVGAARFTLGTGMPLRIPDGVIAKLDLLDPSADLRSALTADNLLRWLQ
jgi:hypothetical protein